MPKSVWKEYRLARLLSALCSLTIAAAPVLAESAEKKEKDSAAKEFGEQLLLKMSEPPKPADTSKPAASPDGTTPKAADDQKTAPGAEAPQSDTQKAALDTDGTSPMPADSQMTAPGPDGTQSDSQKPATNPGATDQNGNTVPNLSPNSFATPASSTVSSIESPSSTSANIGIAAPNPTVPPKNTTNSDKHFFKETLVHNEILDKLAICGISCIVETGPPNILSVLKVKPGSEADFQGLAVGDRITDMSDSNGVFAINIERAGRPYRISLHPGGTPLTALAIRKFLTETINASGVKKPDDVAIGKTPNSLPGEPGVAGAGYNTGIDSSTSLASLLSKYDVEFLIDNTKTMRVLCGLGHMTKLQWCQWQLRDFFDKYKLPNVSLTVCTYSSRNWQTVPHCTTSDLNNIMDYTGDAAPMLEQLASRLRANLDQHHERRSKKRPVLLIVMYDAEVRTRADARWLRQMISDSLKSGTSRKFVVSMFEIGYPRPGGVSLAADLATPQMFRNLLLDHEQFSSINKFGFSQALADALVGGTLLQDSAAANAGASVQQASTRANSRRLPRRLR